MQALTRKRSLRRMCGPALLAPVLAALVAGCAQPPYAAEQRPGDRGNETIGWTDEPGSRERSRVDESLQQDLLAAMREVVPDDWQRQPAPVVRGLRWPEGIRRAVARAGAESGIEFVVVGSSGDEEAHLRFDLRGPRGEPAELEVARPSDAQTFVDPAALSLTAAVGRRPDLENNRRRAERLLAAVTEQLGQEAERAWLETGERE